MTKFDDFDLDITLTKVKDYSYGNSVNWSDECPPIVTKYCATKVCTKICSRNCKTITISCNCSPGDNTTACNVLKVVGIDVARC